MDLNALTLHQGLLGRLWAVKAPSNIFNGMPRALACTAPGALMLGPYFGAIFQSIPSPKGPKDPSMVYVGFP